MNTHGPINEPQTQSYTANLKPDNTATNEVKHYPLVIGTRRVPVMWIGQVYDQFTREVKKKTNTGGGSIKK